jgi:hypothetical protein
MEKYMTAAITFNTPANIHDFPAGSPQDLAVCSQWNTNITGFTQQAILGDPWNLLYSSNQNYYFDTTQTQIPAGSTAVIVLWNAFPNRLAQYLGSNASPANPYKLSNQQLLAIGDQYASTQTPIVPFKPVPTILCPQADWSQPLHMYGPYGPRGWQDEYCEWSVVRDPSSNKINRIDFTCENPEYWNTLWMVDPQRVADLYTETLNWDAPAGASILVNLQDLYLVDSKTFTWWIRNRAKPSSTHPPGVRLTTRSTNGTRVPSPCDQPTGAPIRMHFLEVPCI